MKNEKQKIRIKFSEKKKEKGKKGKKRKRKEKRERRERRERKRIPPCCIQDEDQQSQYGSEQNPQEPFIKKK